MQMNISKFTIKLKKEVTFEVLYNFLHSIHSICKDNL